MNIETGHEKFVNPNTIEGKTTTNDIYHDLSMYLNEMLAEISSEKDKEMNLLNLITYYDYLNAVLVKYTIEHPNKSK